MNFGKNLHLRRLSKNLTQEELADKLNVSRQTVSKWETNEALPEMDKAFELCRIFNCSLDNLFKVIKCSFHKVNIWHRMQTFEEKEFEKIFRSFGCSSVVWTIFIFQFFPYETEIYQLIYFLNRWFCGINLSYKSVYWLKFNSCCDLSIKNTTWINFTLFKWCL